MGPSILFGLEGCTYRIGAGGRKAGADCDLFCHAVAIPLVILTVLDIAADTLVDLATALLILSIHLFYLLSLR